MLNKKQREIIIGSLLGDGSLTKVYGNGNSAFRDAHCPAQLNYLKWKHLTLEPFSLPLKVEKRATIKGFNKSTNSPIMDKNTKSDVWVMRTLSSPEIKELEKQWYLRDEARNYKFYKNRRIKIVPEDIVLTPLSLTVWFLDDGSNLYNGNSKYKSRNAVFHTLGFTFDECEILSYKIKQLGLPACGVRQNKGKPEIVIYSNSYKDFMDMVNKYNEIEDMRYKTKSENYTEPNKKHSAKLSKKNVLEVISLHNAGRKQKDISIMFDVSTATICNIINGTNWSDITGIIKSNEI